ncbi:Rpn family recombination-promoting nuclease/putative transposase [Arachidicoccus terrestris]|uniref:Rpn family recombination-promoting nuclease/putative transposase n=1 Tax=Arachidicoccus terrestris TaxID=2875539 RepID=UPI001CC4768A|nr:Rpn family recombination-promoting nuclease/putative transposase [Arachidicoccus terrestris]UAY53757.1 Rpn family recombination-promoting nuclease/putative transposase [Arachidicoccus terrestris]
MKKYTIDRTCSDLARQACETKPVPADKSGVNEGNASIREEEAGVFVNPLSDAGFKILFEKSGVSENATGLKEGELLRDMLNAFFDERIAPINKVRYKNTELFGETINQRKTVFDIYFVDGTERNFVIEMQDERDEFMVNRARNYICRAHSNALEKGKKFEHRQAPVIGVVIANFYMHQQKEMPCISVIESAELKASLVAIELTKLVTIELPKFNKRIEDLKDKKDVYLFLLKNMGKLKEVPPQFDNDDYRPYLRLRELPI